MWVCRIVPVAIAFAALTIGSAKVVAADDESRTALTAQTDVAHPGAAGHGGTEAHADADPLSIDPDLAIWTLVVFGLLMVILWRFAWGPISQGLERREQTIAGHISAAEQAHQEAKQLLADYERKLAGAADEVRALMEEARRGAEHVKQEILAEAKASADTERNRALRDIEAATDQALKSLAERSADLAVDLAGKILQSKLSASDHTRLIQEAMARFPQHQPSHN